MITALNDETGYDIITGDDLVRLGLAALRRDIDVTDLDPEMKDRVEPIIDHVSELEDDQVETDRLEAT